MYIILSGLEIQCVKLNADMTANWLLSMAIWFSLLGKIWQMRHGMVAIAKGMTYVLAINIYENKHLNKGHKYKHTQPVCISVVVEVCVCVYHMNINIIKNGTAMMCICSIVYNICVH